MPSASGLSAPHRIRARDLAMQAAFMGLRHTKAIHYSQGAARWNWHKHHMKPWRGKYPRALDCSSFATWCLWCGLDHYGFDGPTRSRDIVNGQNWLAGWTGTQVQHGKHVVHENNIMRGDLAHYGDPVGRSGHVAVCIGKRDGVQMVISHGSEAGPMLLPLHYRSDLRQIRRYI